ncbi:MAG TPA: XdhC family protein [Trebonia sp.]|nr:XdhC family protein [Trebonia sp.]
MADEHEHTHDGQESAQPADGCAVAHGTATRPSASPEPRPAGRTLVAIFATPVATFLLRYGADAGFRGVLVEPDQARAAGAKMAGLMAGFEVVEAVPEDLDDSADVVVTDHHRDELGPALRDALAGKARWVGIMGNPRHPGPHVESLAALGVPPAEVARVHRPIGLNIGSRTPAEIAISTLAGLLADRNDRPGGFTF